MNKSNFYILIVLFVLGACNPPAPSNRTEAYFDFEKLLSDQQLKLATKNILLHKTIWMGDSSNTEIYETDSSTWGNELALFQDINLNNPVLRGQYKVQLSKDTASNLQIMQHRSLDKTLPIKKLDVFYLSDPERPRKIEIEYNESNLIYDTYRVLNIEFDTIFKDLVVVKYGAKGHQKMIFKDSLSFSFESQLQFRNLAE